MIVICSWCNKVTGEKSPFEDKSITHGICEECRRKVSEEIDLEDKVEAENH